MNASDITNRRKTRTVFANFTVQQQQVKQGLTSNISSQSGRLIGDDYLISVTEGATYTTVAEQNRLLTDASAPAPTPSPAPSYSWTHTANVLTGYVGTLPATLVIPSELDGCLITELDSNLFLNNTSIVNVTIPDSVTSIGESTFFGCTSLASIIIPNLVTTIGDNAFMNCSALTTVSFTPTSTLGIIPVNMFSGCTSLTSITIPNSVTSISAYAFQDCLALSSITIGNSVTSIGVSTFSGCTSLTSIIIPNSVTSIGNNAFTNCTSLASITIGNSVTIIGTGVFQGCTSLASVTFTPTSTLGTIGDYTFQGCTSLSSITIPISVISIGVNAFGSSGLITVTIANGQLGITSPTGNPPGVSFFGVTVATVTGVCLIGSTQIHLADKSVKSLESIQVDDTIVSFDPTISTYTTVTVLSIQSFRAPVFSINDGLLVCTASHNHYVRQNGIWSVQTTDNLHIGDYFMDINNSFVEIKSIVSQETPVEVFNIKVDGNHLYYANTILTHNKP